LKLTIESTTRVVIVNGVPARIWEGTSESGVRVLCLVTRVAVESEQDCSQFERELSEQRAPSSESLEAFPLRLLL
jgi:hypothetical protein